MKENYHVEEESQNDESKTLDYPQYNHFLDEAALKETTDQEKK